MAPKEGLKPFHFTKPIIEKSYTHSITSIYVDVVFEIF